MIKKRFRIQGMHCTACAMLIDGSLEDLAGVKAANTHYARQMVDVEYDEKQLSEADILAIIAEVGYTAQVSSY